MFQKLCCDLCAGVLREVRADGTVKYMDGDHTRTPSNATGGCKCGFKHFWDGKEYDNQPKRFVNSLKLSLYDKKAVLFFPSVQGNMVI